MQREQPDKPDRVERLRALGERLKSQVGEPTRAEIEREVAALRQLPRIFRPPSPSA